MSAHSRPRRASAGNSPCLLPPSRYCVHDIAEPGLAWTFMYASYQRPLLSLRELMCSSGEADVPLIPSAASSLAKSIESPVGGSPPPRSVRHARRRARASPRARGWSGPRVLLAYAWLWHDHDLRCAIVAIADEATVACQGFKRQVSRWLQFPRTLRVVSYAGSGRGVGQALHHLYTTRSCQTVVVAKHGMFGGREVHLTARVHADPHAHRRGSMLAKYREQRNVNSGRPMDTSTSSHGDQQSPNHNWLSGVDHSASPASSPEGDRAGRRTA